ncbi:MAG TPA: hypothetical protein EYH26_02010 [Pyrodictium sp.]|nr:hypothetical protein [Pyrodictium sp.]
MRLDLRSLCLGAAVAWLRIPPRIKVLEALSAIADGRVELVSKDKRFAKVRSSMGDKVYTVYVDPVKGEAYSDDNGTRYRSYIGYPIISLLMLQGVLPFDQEIAEALKNVAWKELNEKYKRYDVVEKIVLLEAEKRGVKPEKVRKFVDKVYRELKRLRLRKLEKPPALGLDRFLKKQTTS